MTDREKIVRIVANIQRVDVGKITDATVLGPKVLSILMTVAVVVRKSLYVNNLLTATMGDLVKQCKD